MMPEVEALIAKGRRSLAASRNLLDLGHHDFSASRAYYAMFCLAEAVLLSRGLAFSRHSAVIAAFGEHLVKPGHFPVERHAALRRAFDQRNIGDYGFSAAFPEAAARDLLG